MRDQYGREIDYLRISITDRCNLRCRYCMPQGVDLVSHADILSYEEILRVAQVAARLGIRKIRVTGGEPLVRKNVSALIARLKAIPGIEKVALTTNGLLLAEQLPDLLQAGLDQVNISLDTTDEEEYRRITGFPGAQRVLQALREAVKTSLVTKVNSVYADDWENLVRLAEEMPVDVRFIEMMPIGYGARESGRSNQELLAAMLEKYPDLTRTDRVCTESVGDRQTVADGPAVCYQSESLRGRIGLISPLSAAFCKQCNRIRLTSRGFLKSCLCYDQGEDLMPALRGGLNGEAAAEELERRLRKAILEKPMAHCFRDPESVSEEQEMFRIGG